MSKYKNLFKIIDTIKKDQESNNTKIKNLIEYIVDLNSNYDSKLILKTLSILEESKGSMLDSLDYLKELTIMNKRKSFHKVVQTIKEDTEVENKKFEYLINEMIVSNKRSDLELKCFAEIKNTLEESEGIFHDKLNYMYKIFHDLEGHFFLLDNIIDIVGKLFD